MHGHSLVEMLAVLAAAGALYAAASPSFSALVSDHRRTATVNGVVAALNHARHASIVEARGATVCASADGERCGGDWHAGWIAFREPPGWRTGHAIPAANVLYRAGPAHPALAVMSNRNAFRFRPHRRRATNGTLVVCQVGRPGRAIVIAPSGRVRTTDAVPDWAATACR